MRQNRQTAIDAASETVDALPRWDLTAAFPGIDSDDFRAGFQHWLDAIAALEALFDAEQVGSGSDSVSSKRFERVLSALNNTLDRTMTMGAYLSALVSANSRDEAAQARLSQFSIAETRLHVLRKRFTAWIGAIDLESTIAASPLAAAHAFPLRKEKRAAAHLLPPAEEALAAALAPAGMIAWSKLHDNLTSQMKGEVEIDGAARALPLSAIRNLSMAPDRDLRRRAHEAELAMLEANAVPIAAALNGVKGQVVVLDRRRGWADPLDASLFTSNIDRQTLDALLAAARAAFPDLRRYLRLKAKALGLQRLAWWDLFAPVGRSNRRWDWPDAVAFLEDQFGFFSDRLRGLAGRAVAERWIDVGPRPGKVGGAYCSWLIGDQSRILMNFSPTYDAVSTLAHELGHAYHNLNLSPLTPLQAETPMTLAETASTFCETIVREAALRDADDAEQLFIIEQSLQGACQVVLDIISRFEFERSVFAIRPERELSVGDFSRLMLDAQRNTYGDGLDPDRLHPSMWAVKGHYYIPDFSYYNYPYLFGLLFGLGLYARHQADPVGFIDNYDRLLASTGQADAADLAARFGIDIRSTDFWTASLDLIRADVDRFAALVETVDTRQR